jgi:GNAT superfamily N-acetyltransferase
MSKLTINKVLVEELKFLLPLFTKYQQFYGAESSEQINKEFLTEILSNPDKGVFHVIYFNGQAIGFSGVYVSYSSVLAKQIAIINDLFILDEYRGLGYGKTLINQTIEFLKNHNFTNIRWCTKSENKNSQKLYNEFEANKSDWVHYDLKITK